MRYQIRELGLGGILDQAIDIVKNHFALLMGIVLILYFPATLLMTYLLNDMVQAMLPAAPGDLAAQVNIISQALLMIPLFLLHGFVVAPLTNAAVIHAVASEYLERPTTVKASLSRAVRVYFPLLWTTILFVLILYAGMVLCIVPGIFWLFQNILYNHVVVIEGPRGVPAIRRSKLLMRSDAVTHFSTAFLLVLLLGLIQLSARGGAGLIPQPHVALVCQVLIDSVLVVFATAALVVFYFSCRCKAENYDLLLLAQAVATEDSGPAATGDLAPS